MTAILKSASKSNQNNKPGITGLFMFIAIYCYTSILFYIFPLDIALQLFISF